MSLLPSCRETSELLSRSLDEGRPLGMHVRIHLSICDACSRVLAQFALLGAFARKAPEAGPGLSDAAKDRLRRAIGSD